jgi:hypothetical protein
VNAAFPNKPHLLIGVNVAGNMQQCMKKIGRLKKKEKQFEIY